MAAEEDEDDDRWGVWGRAGLADVDAASGSTPRSRARPGGRLPISPTRPPRTAASVSTPAPADWSILTAAAAAYWARKVAAPSQVEVDDVAAAARPTRDVRSRSCSRSASGSTPRFSTTGRADALGASSSAVRREATTRVAARRSVARGAPDAPKALKRAPIPLWQKRRARR